MRAGRLVVGLALGLALSTAAMAGELGKPAPSFTGAELDGRAIMLDDFKAIETIMEQLHKLPR